jgi:hypothetical protein
VGGGDLDARVAEAVSRFDTPEQVAASLRAQPNVRDATVRPGLVKTDPPLVELRVDQLVPDAGADAVVSRIYDLAVHPDGTLHLRGSHDA